jgi:membrane-associated phospholipid phosphatase
LQALAGGLALLVPVALLAVGGHWVRGRTDLLDRVELPAAVSVLGVSLLKYPLKFAFSYTWPATFYEHNPSLLHDGVYGFHPSQGGVAYSAFPSGHAAAAAVATVLWMYAPRCRDLAVGLWLAVSVGLLGAYYHFAGDVFVGPLLGIFVASLALRGDVRAPEPRPLHRD